MDADGVEASDGGFEGSKIEAEGEISRDMNAPRVTPTGILRVDSGKTRRTSLDIKLLSQHEPASPQPSVDRLSVTFADDSQRNDRTESSPKTMDKVHFPTGNTDEENSDDEDYSASVYSIMQRRASTRRSKKRSGRRGSSPFSPDILPDNESGRRRSSVFTTSSGDTAITMEDSFTPSVTQDQIFENIKLHKEVLGSVKMQPWNMRKKLRLVMQAKAYIKKHEGALQERLAQSHSTKDILARCNIYLIKKWQHFKREAANLSNWLIPWEKRIKEIESHFGSVVASYFIFLRWLFWVNMVIAIVLIAFIAVPEMLMADFKKDPERKMILPEDRYNSTNFLTLWDFEGVFKYSPMFYGWYTNLDLVDKAYRLPLAYFFTGLAVYVYSFVATLRKMAKNSRMSKLSEKEDECIFSWKLFTGWDYMIGNAETAHNRVASIVMSFKEALLEEAEKKRESKSWKLIGSRILVNTAVLGLLFLSAFAVVTVVARSNEKEANSTTWRRNEITVVMSLISLFFPILFELLGYFEHYHPRKQLRLQLARIMVLNLLNLYSLIFALFGKISNMTNDLQALKPPNITSLSQELTTTKFPIISPQPTEIASFNNCYTICEQTGLEIANLISATLNNLKTTPTPETVQQAISATLNNLTQSVTPTPLDLSNVFKIDLSGFKNKLQDFLNDITDEGKWNYLEITMQSTPTTTIEEITSTLKIENKCKLHCEALNETLKAPVMSGYQKRSKLRSLCWETMFGQELMKLTVMDLVMTVLSSLAIDFLRGLFVRYMNNFWCWDLEKTFPQYGDFKVAENILHLVNNQGMVWMGMFFSPGLVVLNVIKLYIMMYLRSWAVLACNVPHEIIFRASRSNNFYFALLLMMLFLCVLPVGYTIVWLEPSWHCGPFSRYHRIFHIFTKTIKKALPEPFHKILDYIASPGIVIPLLMLLVLIIYYLISLTNALREANNDLKIQLRRERTEERRKMFQIADRRRRSGSGGSGELNQLGKWKKLLQGMPGNKSFDETPKEVSEIEDQQQIAAKKVLSRFIFRSIKNRKRSINQSDEDSVLHQDDGTDTEQHESLPDDASFRMKPMKLDSLDIGEKRPHRKLDSLDSDKRSNKNKDNFRLKLDSLEIGERPYKKIDHTESEKPIHRNKNRENKRNKVNNKSKDSCDSEENKLNNKSKESCYSEENKNTRLKNKGEYCVDSEGNKKKTSNKDSLDSQGNKKKFQLKKMDSLEPVLPKQKQKHKHNKKLDSLDSVDRKLKKLASLESTDKKLRKFDSLIRSSTESGDKHVSIKEPSSKKKETVHRVDSISSNWSENIPVITISKTESTECILENLADQDVEANRKHTLKKQVSEVEEETVEHSGSRAMNLLRSKFGGDLRKSGENSGSFFKSMIRDKHAEKMANNDLKKDAELSKREEVYQKSDNLERVYNKRHALKKQASEAREKEVGHSDSNPVKLLKSPKLFGREDVSQMSNPSAKLSEKDAGQKSNSCAKSSIGHKSDDNVLEKDTKIDVKNTESGNTGRATRFFLNFFKRSSSDKNKTNRKDEEEHSKPTKITEECISEEKSNKQQKKENVGSDKIKSDANNKEESEKINSIKNLDERKAIHITNLKDENYKEDSDNLKSGKRLHENKPIKKTKRQDETLKDTPDNSKLDYIKSTKPIDEDVGEDEQFIDYSEYVPDKLKPDKIKSMIKEVRKDKKSIDYSEDVTDQLKDKIESTKPTNQKDRKYEKLNSSSDQLKSDKNLNKSDLTELTIDINQIDDKSRDALDKSKININLDENKSTEATNKESWKDGKLIYYQKKSIPNEENKSNNVEEIESNKLEENRDGTYLTQFQETGFLENPLLRTSHKKPTTKDFDQSEFGKSSKMSNTETEIIEETSNDGKEILNENLLIMKLTNEDDEILNLEKEKKSSEKPPCKKIEQSLMKDKMVEEKLKDKSPTSNEELPRSNNITFYAEKDDIPTNLEKPDKSESTPSLKPSNTIEENLNTTKNHELENQQNLSSDETLRLKRDSIHESASSKLSEEIKLQKASCEEPSNKITLTKPSYEETVHKSYFETSKTPQQTETFKKDVSNTNTSKKPSEKINLPKSSFETSKNPQQNKSFTEDASNTNILKNPYEELNLQKSSAPITNNEKVMMTSNIETAEQKDITDGLLFSKSTLKQNVSNETLLKSTGSSVIKESSLKETPTAKPSTLEHFENASKENSSKESLMTKPSTSVISENTSKENSLKESLITKPSTSNISKNTPTINPSSSVILKESKKESKSKPSFFSKLRKRKDHKLKKIDKDKGHEKPDDTLKKEEARGRENEKQDRLKKGAIEIKDDKEDLDDMISPITKRISFKFPAISKNKPETSFNTNVFFGNVSDQAVGTLKSLEKYTPTSLNTNVPSKNTEELNLSISKEDDAKKNLSTTLLTENNEDNKEKRLQEMKSSATFSVENDEKLQYKDTNKSLKLPDEKSKHITSEAEIESTKPIIVFEHLKPVNKSVEIEAFPTFSGIEKFLETSLIKKSTDSSDSEKSTRTPNIAKYTKSSKEPKSTDFSKISLDKEKEGKSYEKEKSSEEPSVKITSTKASYEEFVHKSSLKTSKTPQQTKSVDKSASNTKNNSGLEIKSTKPSEVEKSLQIDKSTKSPENEKFTVCSKIENQPGSSENDKWTESSKTETSKIQFVEVDKFTKSPEIEISPVKAKSTDCPKVKKSPESSEIEIGTKSVELPDNASLGSKKFTDVSEIQKQTGSSETANTLKTPQKEKPVDICGTKKPTKSLKEENSTRSPDIEKLTESLDIEKLTDYSDIEKLTESSGIEKPTDYSEIEKLTESLDIEKLTESSDIEKSLKSTEVKKSTESSDKEKSTESFKLEKSLKLKEKTLNKKGLELFSESSEDDLKNSPESSELKKAESEKSSSFDESGKFDTVKRRKMLGDLKPQNNETESSTEYKDGTISN